MRDYFSWLAKLLTILMLLLVIPVMMAGVIAMGSAVHEEGGTDSRYSVAIVELTGVIEDSTAVVRELYKRAADDSIKAIVLRIDSPGGAVAPSQDVYDAVVKLKERKPIVASMGSVAASGGFYAAVGASKVVAQPGTLTGSIGVIMQIPNFSKVAERIGVDMVTIKSGALKDAGNSFRAMSDAERAYLEDTAHKVHESFIEAVASGRGKTLAEVRPIADGRIIVGSEAKTLGFVDSFGGVHEAAKIALSLAKVELPEGTLPKLIYSEDRLSEIRALLEGVSRLPAVWLGGRALELRFQMY